MNNFTVLFVDTCVVIGLYKTENEFEEYLDNDVLVHFTLIRTRWMLASLHKAGRSLMEIIHEHDVYLPLDLSRKEREEENNKLMSRWDGILDGNETHSFRLCQVLSSFMDTKPI